MFVKYDNTFPVRFTRQSGKRNLVVPHYHEEAEILAVTGGEVLIEAGASSLKCRQGDLLVFYPNTLHQVSAESEAAEIASLSYKTDLTLPAGRFAQVVGGFCLFKEDHPEYAELCSLFGRISSVFDSDRSTQELEVTALLLLLSAVLIREGVMTPADSKKGESRLQPALAFIEENYNGCIKISDLEKLLNLSKEHIIRLFKAETGKTPAEYVLDIKIKRSMELLKEGELSVTEISSALGFSSPSHFSKTFKSRLETTPRQYQKSLRNDKA